MRKKEIGQTLVMVLILLGIGALLVVPSLRLTGTSLKSSQVVERQMKGLYAADAAQEFILWKLLYDLAWRNGALQDNDDSDQFDFYVCDVPVSTTVVMRAVPGEGGTVLSTDDLIRPTKTVEPSEVSDAGNYTFTYIIKLEQLSSDTSQGLDAVYDVLPKDFEYVSGSSRIRVDGGGWEAFPEPSIYTTGGQDRLRWPSSSYFTEPMRSFGIMQDKEIEFQVNASVKKNTTYYNWVLLKLGDINTLSGPQAPIVVPDGSGKEGGLLEATKASEPSIIQPGVETDIMYTITVTNLDAETHQLQEVTDYLPPDFIYLGPTTGDFGTSDPQLSLETINGLERWVLFWDLHVSILAQETLTMTFWAKATKDVSGSYYNEFVVVPNTPIPGIFQPPDMDVTYEDFNVAYSWNTGVVMVPAYDSQSEAEGVTINANMALILGGITIKSWQVD